MLTDVVALEREFDYAVPQAWHDDGRAGRLTVGTMVRVTLKGRRVGGWVTACDPPSGEPPGHPVPPGGLRAGGDSRTAVGPAPELAPLAKLVGVGPPAEVLELAGWAARHWAGRRATFYGTASPPRVVGDIARSAARRVPALLPADAAAAAGASVWESAFDRAVSLVRIPPAGDRGPLLSAALRRGDVLLVVPGVAEASRLAAWVRRRGVPVSLLPEGWAQAAAGGVAVGTRAAVFGPMPHLAGIVVLDEHDESLVAADSPSWSAREVAVERARRAGVPCVLVSPIPSLEARVLASGEPLTSARPIEREGWPNVEVVDQRDPEVGRAGLLSATLVARLRSCDRAVCVLNRKGRARLLACTGCGDLVVCDACGATVGEVVPNGTDERPGALVCARCGERRPRVCSSCGATRLKTLRPGVNKLREELEVLLGERVTELTGSTSSGEPGDLSSRIVIGTEAALHRVPRADLVAFLDFDQELSAPRYRANEQAMALLARAARLVGPRSGGGRILVQTRRADHPAVEAARAADPDLLSRHDRELRRQLGFPPFGALAEVAGEAAGAFMGGLGRPLGLEVSELGENRWVVRAADRDQLLDALATVERPPGRLRLAIDPLRL
ncbi:MAG: hypothetical protein OXH20_07235 [bacterium]|nr:hypothetical protein [bacterium]MYB25154.1 hypothetical protein [Acidimicrobiia bacterium]